MKKLLFALLIGSAFFALPSFAQDKCKKQTLRDGRFSLCADAVWTRETQLRDDILGLAFRDDAKGAGASLRVLEITSTNSAQQMAKELEQAIKRKFEQNQQPTAAIEVADFETSAGRVGKRVAYQIRRDATGANGAKQITYFINNPGGRVIQINVVIGYGSADGEKYAEAMIDPLARTLKVNPPLPR